MSKLYRAPSYTDAEYAALEVLGYSGPCMCFTFNGLHEGHNVNPPCETVTLARKLVQIGYRAGYNEAMEVVKSREKA